MIYHTIQVSHLEHVYNITISHLEHNNAINEIMLNELHSVMDLIEKKDDCKLIVLRGKNGNFCSGMDIQDINGLDQQDAVLTGGKVFWRLLYRMSTLPKIIIAVVDGKVVAGGVGLLVACDLVISSRCSQFSLPEALWGLLPCCVLPFLARRVGRQKAYNMMLTTQVMLAEEAYRIHLVDELDDEPERILKKHLHRLGNLGMPTIRSLKQYANNLWPLREEYEDIALNEYNRLISSPVVVGNIKNFIELGIFPWEK